MSRIARLLAILTLTLATTAAARGDEQCGADPSLPAQARDVVRAYATDGGRLTYRGISASRLDSSTFVVVVDFGDRQDMMLLLLRKFIDDKGGGYWRASPVDSASAALFGARLKAP
jgi:hypothetical protein